MTARIDTPALRVNRERPLAFTFGGRQIRGLHGDTVASALWANGQRIFSRSFKYHRPRGLFSMDGESANTLMQIDRLPNVRAELTPLREGMSVAPQNIRGSLDFDFMAGTELFSRFLQPGFYYKMFHKPYRLWPFFQNRIKQAAGLGKIDTDWQPGEYDNLFLNTDVCVVGGGPAGLAAALTAADLNLRVIILEARPWLGGAEDWRTTKTADGKPRFAAVRSLAQQVAAHENIQVFTAAPLTGLYHDHLLTAHQRGQENDAFDERYLEIRARSVVMATGSSERPLIFENNERPGIMTAACAARLIMHYGLKPGQRVVFSTGHDAAVETAEVLHRFGIEVAAFADSRPRPPADSVRRIETLGAPLMSGWAATKAVGRSRVQAVELNQLDASDRKRVECDLLVASAGSHPVMGPLLLTRQKPRYDEREGIFSMPDLPAGIHPAGGTAGITPAPGNAVVAVEANSLSGKLAGLLAAADCGLKVEAGKIRRQLADARQTRTDTRLAVAPGHGHKRFVCFDEDVTTDNIRRTIAEGFDAVELCKRYATVGMGPSQSGIPGVNLPLVMARQLGIPAGDIAPTVVRPPLTPTLLATYVGKDYRVEKRTPLHQAQAQGGAEFMWMGKWTRPRHFGRDESARSEIEAVHQRVGIIDVSTLGKFRIYGPDALKALQLLYVSNMADLAEDRLKYVAMCNRDGCLIDDGVATRLGPDDYYFTTSSARAAETVAWFQYWTRDRDWNYRLVNLTDTLGAINIAGPRARQVLSQLVDDDIGNSALPYMGFKTTRIRDTIPVKLLRVGFVGELGYEIHAPSSFLRSIWDLLLEAGREFGIAPFGIEAQNVLRLEKAHVIIGLDSEYKTTLCDVGLGFLWDRRKKDGDAIGVAALRHTEKQTGRNKLVGFEMNDPADLPPDFALVIDSQIRGHVTGARHSEALGKTIGLALVDDEMAEIDTPLELYTDGIKGTRMNAKVVARPFYDPRAERLRA